MTWAICHKSGTVLFTTSDERTMLNRKSHGWVIKMSTISNERLEEIRDYDTCVRLDESAAMATELLALRKERERAEPVAYMVGTQLLENMTQAKAYKADTSLEIKPLYAEPPC